MLTDSNFLPYGKSMIEARKIWKQLTLMEELMLIHRIMSRKRIFKIDIGNIPSRS